MEPLAKPLYSRTAIYRAKSWYVNMGKPLMDVTVSFFGLLLTFPLMMVIALWIRLDSPGPVLFRQSRIGKDGKEFQIYKFRTMHVHVPSQGRSPESNRDPRITRAGHFLRKTSLDELPQLINILKGDMSLVGPRPEQKLIVEKYYTWHERQRFLVKPGITGPWQISGDRTKPIHENLEHDLRYIRTISLKTDLKVLIQTLLVMIRSNTY
ncbi:lipopolysaccharide/colanic/teichoic acid biosynthesis glycosyltransferase [Melghirimyces profundicolus]|uniref:Lipopolysaccharide/colanic/teichoic acid biosynthesis glycosyltransferase n=1 Tax=Melghirimyces profundicolus TaxID=1242148 RepID=A0A2T6BCD4_9BACL|nr:sugar transferase [Melghirimyces profundicolus]PTX53729.1 lipopolysaccharide/colanic/teichoic acid biosynthesis glycosyltransferase [Melghirimyces profundicolus]